MKQEMSEFNNGLFEFLKTEEEFVIEGEKKCVKRTMVRRSPGIRALIINDKNEILLSREYRYELADWDFRLPGGKVFDSLEDYKSSLKNDTVMEHVIETVPKEVHEEVGLVVENPKLIKVSKDGASVIWDLYYFEIRNFEKASDGTQLEENEIVDGYKWYSFDKVIEMCRENKIHEDRTVGVLLTYILNSRK